MAFAPNPISSQSSSGHSSGRDTFTGLSLAFYAKDQTLREITESAQKGTLFSGHVGSLQPDLVNKFTQFSKSKLDSQRQTLKESAEAVYNTFAELIERLHNDYHLMLYVIPTLDGMLFDDRKQIAYLVKRLQDQETKEINIMKRLSFILQGEHDSIVYEATARVLSILLSELDPKVYWLHQENHINFLMMADKKGEKRQLREYAIANSLVNLLRLESLSKHFLKAGGIEILSKNLQNQGTDIQTSYYTFFCLWLLSFEEFSVKYFADPALLVIKRMIQVMQSLSKEKLIRLGYSTFRNLSNSAEALELMVDNGLIKVTSNILKSIIKDKETKDDVEFIDSVLEKNLKVLTSFEKYCKEVNSTIFEWGPIHTERFWRENVKKFEENDFFYIKKIVSLLHTEKVEFKHKNQAIACFDLGEFCRFHPFGKNILEKLGAKEVLMDLFNSSNSTVKENAILAIQKMMINNWQAASA